MHTYATPAMAQGIALGRMEKITTTVTKTKNCKQINEHKQTTCDSRTGVNKQKLTKRAMHDGGMKRWQLEVVARQGVWVLCACVCVCVGATNRQSVDICAYSTTQRWQAAIFTLPLHKILPRFRYNAPPAARRQHSLFSRLSTDVSADACGNITSTT